MPNYAYVLKDPKGIKKQGVITTTNQQEAITKLQESGNVVISLKAAREGSEDRQLTINDKVKASLDKIQNSVPLNILVFFTRQLATMFSAGLTLEKSLTNITEEQKHKRFRKVCEEITADVKRGQSLSDALQKYPAVFSSLYVAIVKAGEVSGTLHTTLEELADYLEMLEDTKRKVISAMAYPVVILTFTAIVVVAMVVLLVPEFKAIYDKVGAELPPATAALIVFSNFLAENGLVTFFILAIMLIGIWISSLTNTGALIIDTVKLKFPIVGNLVNGSIMSKYSRTLSILLASGVPVLDAFKLVNKVVDNIIIERGISKIMSSIKEGTTIAHAMRLAGVFPNILLQLAATGEETGEIDQLLGKAADFYDKQVDATITRLTSVIEPILIIIMAIAILSVVFTIYFPIFYLGEAYLKQGGVR
ncbi:MAG: type II secretion system F family protein [Calditrichaeota bacterium]|nr:MAG: type II secretion system F family protein [Calditrichota bacterium]